MLIRCWRCIGRVSRYRYRYLSATMISGVSKTVLRYAGVSSSGVVCVNGVCEDLASREDVTPCPEHDEEDDHDHDHDHSSCGDSTFTSSSSASASSGGGTPPTTSVTTSGSGSGGSAAATSQGDGDSTTEITVLSLIHISEPTRPY